jgi:4-amino-4-deoxy-L-arabinose transferase-like glycosyltransferase
VQAPARAFGSGIMRAEFRASENRMQQERSAAATAEAGGVRPRGRAAGRVQTALGRWGDTLRAWAVANQTDIAIVSAITLLAALLRLADLGTVPLGLHGDEAWTGIDARRILDEGSIGPYVGSALGQPTGPLYWTALLFGLGVPETTLGIRFSMALIGIATIPTAYLAFATMFNRTVAAIGALILAVMMWHLHLSRLGFMVVSWPFMEMLALWLVFVAIRRKSLWLFLAAGAAHGLGVYSYNAYLLFVPVPFIALALMLQYREVRIDWRRYALMCVAFGAAALLFAWPLVRYVQDNRDEYEGHQKVVNLNHQQRWKDADTGGKVDLLWERFKEWNAGLVYGDRADLGDGLGVEDTPVVHPLIYVFALVGLAFAVWQIRQPAYAVLVASVLLLPWGALITIDDGIFRRTTGITPFIAVLAALPLARLWQAGARYRDVPSIAVVWGAVLLVPAVAGIAATYRYFGPVQDNAATEYVFPYQLDAASRYIDDLPDDAFVYFYSDRWSFDYETRRFLAPDAQGIDRSVTFRQGAPSREAPLDIGIGAEADGKRVVFVFLDPYDGNLTDRGLLADVAALHPDGEPVESKRGDEVLFRAYEIDADR